MTQEEKNLVLKDICARVPYNVVVHVEHDWIYREVKPYDCILHTGDMHPIQKFIRYEEHEIRPYLRPMSSMTEEEREELSDYLCEQVMSNKIGITIPPNSTQGKGIPFIWMDDCLNWLNKKGFDYRGLIPMGLALEAPKDMYK